MNEEKQENQESKPKKSDIVFKVVVGICVAIIVALLVYSVIMGISKLLN